MRQKSLVLLVPFILLTIIGTCQSDSLSIKAIYDKEVIYFSGNRYFKNEIKYPLRELANEFDKNSEAYLLFRAYKTDYRKAKFYYIAGSILTISSLLVAPDNLEAGTGLLLGGIISYALTFRFAIRADKRLKKAVWLRNRGVLIQ